MTEKLRKNNTTGHTGVNYRKPSLLSGYKTGCWVARYGQNHTVIGQFKTKEEAVEARRKFMSTVTQKLEDGESREVDITTLKIHQIAKLIRQDWGKPNYAAVPYLNAMRDISDIGDKYGADDARSIVMYFLGNASSWRGPVSHKIKQELRRRVK